MIQIYGADDLNGRVELIYNPLTELSLALDLLCDPGHHMLHFSWATDVLANLAKKEKDQLSYYERLIGGYLNLDLQINYLSYDYKSSIPSIDCSEYLKDPNNWLPGLSHSDMEKLTRFIGFMWDNYIYPVVVEHLQVLKEQIASGLLICINEGATSLLQKVNERITLKKNGVLTIEKWLESEFHAADIKTFYIELSLFAFPHLVVSDRSAEGYFFLSWDVRFRNDKLVAPGIDRISTTAFALSDKSRLRILLMLAEAPMTQKDVGRLMGFAKSTISRHINILLDAGLIEANGGGRNVRLSLKDSGFRTLSYDIGQWLGRLL